MLISKKKKKTCPFSHRRCPECPSFFLSDIDQCFILKFAPPNETKDCREELGDIERRRGSKRRRSIKRRTHEIGILSRARDLKFIVPSDFDTKQQ